MNSVDCRGCPVLVPFPNRKMHESWQAGGVLQEHVLMVVGDNREVPRSKSQLQRTNILGCSNPMASHVNVLAARRILARRRTCNSLRRVGCSLVGCSAFVSLEKGAKKTLRKKWFR